ncbi:aminotransferase class I/II-fold pyridoxal phosphate-dependent enzyme [Leeuwenhoekiella palythoae]|uniref:Glycine C-acetyltransferase n=2 Tax=Leeuwenhoekiella TaxID=283735 RepID=A0A1M5TGB0_9FLAO|nr:aminotransferase class I/II-fold pyridoxal phosphate-dependent enzyme [Leeuwenhoekiella palythoae]MBH13523.1 8-amino-7-oxononanoate synthase [Leeuwenhoekiella sp.]MEC7783796.1 aminotransferase class I/II-fold pyridoxal phosphate-dependent enzyme [Bacteroidota bacterium]MEE3146956.1 aminotransferase class I/II-fold pyridoxal phosphate-dependent enzyme [Bacteroidota bacterium]RXG28667.1 glycine C-acetyltransferase [Leeuwenhoekiella palythoae]UBZ09839.1 aminotransferase class I/II-fold pyridox|tara:strand:+ start:803 stop:2062 length:1260 start_codon:yes stop_codon:yes gene_type:complete
MKDLFDKIYKDKGPLGKWAAQAEGYFVFPKLEGPISNRMKFQGKDVITWSVNDYLGLANNAEVRKVDADAAAQYGSAYPMGARMMSGHTSLHEQLQDELAAFVQKEAAYLLNFGYQGMVSTVDALVAKDDIIVYDVDAHACIIDGVRLHMGKRFTYKHNDIESIEKNLQRATKLAEQTGGGILLISEGVFGMRGEQGRLKEIVALKEKYNFRLFVDDAHGFGTLGATGAGAGEEQGVQDGIDVYFATFAKSMASTGAFIAADQEIIDYLKYNLRSQMFAKSLQMQLVVGALKRLDMLRTMPELREKLWENVNALQNGLKDRGFDIGTTQSCVTPVYLKGSIPEAMALVKDLRENHGIFCSIVVYPVIPKGLILLRLIPTASHTLQDVEETLDAFSAIRERLENGTYKRLSAGVQASMEA